MLSNMSKSVFNGLAALTVAIPVLAWSNLLPVHSVRAPTLYFFSHYENGQASNATFLGGSALVSWQENSLQGFGNLRATLSDAKTGAVDQLELKMVRVTSSNLDTINGEWDVFKNGEPTCAGCVGSLYVSPPNYQGNAYLKGYVQNTKRSYSFGGYLDTKGRIDY
ncbi:hypothetical protein [Melittangium boletus]|uniref:hypothetical protein n=1 Tax=Melittangium boletus TaxID=83453 RepID=UPI003DA45C44